MKYRKLPVEVEARLVTRGTAVEIAEWIREGDGEGYVVGSPIGIEIHTLEGVMTADEGDYVIKGVAGEFYPCKPDIFEQTYEVVE